MEQREEAEGIRRAFIRNLGDKADLVRVGELIPCPEEGGFYFPRSRDDGTKENPFAKASVGGKPQ